MAGSVAQAFEHTDTASGVTSVVAATLTGNAIVAACTNDNSTAATITAGDPTNGATSYTLLDDVVDTGDQQRMTTFGKSGSAASGSVNVTFTWSAANSFKAGLVVDCTGVPGALDQHAASYQPTPTLTTDAQTSGNTAALNSQPALVVGIGFNSNGTSAPNQGSTGWSAPVSGVATFWSFGGPVQTRVEWKRVTATAAVAALFTATSNTNSITAVITIDETGGGSSTPQVRLSSIPPFFMVGPGRFSPGPKFRSQTFNTDRGTFLTGNAVTAISGTAAPAVSIAATGTSATGSSGSVTPSMAAGLTAPQLSAAAGSVTTGGNVTLSITGNAATTTAGALAPSTTVGTIAGASGTSSTGTASPAFSLASTGVSATGASGAQTPSRSVAVTGIALAGSAGNVLLPFVSRYPIVTTASSRKMFDQQGNPFRVKGRTAWGLAGLTPSLRQAFLDDTIAHGFNAVEAQIPTHLSHINNVPQDGAGNLPFLKRLDGTTWTGGLSPFGSPHTEAPDFTTPNPTFWAFADGIVQDCYTRNILLFMFPAYLGDGSGDGWQDEMQADIDVLGDTSIITYGAFIANRYKSFPNIVWCTAGDTASGFDPENDLIIGLQSVSGQASGPNFTSERAGGQISTDGSGPLGASTTLNGAYDWATVITQCQRAYSFASPVMPGYLIEEPYDEEGTDGTGVNTTFSTQPVRRYEWWGWLNAIGGYIAGNGYVWRFALTGTPTATDDYRNHLNTQNTQDLARLNAFMELWPNTNDLVPGGLGSMRALVVSGAGTIDTGNFVCAAQATDGTLMIGYTPPGGSGTFSLDLRSMAARPLRARWWDPTAATFSTNGTAAGTFSLSSAASAQSFTAPATNSAGDADWVLVLDAQIPFGAMPSAPFNVVGPGRFRSPLGVGKTRSFASQTSANVTASVIGAAGASATGTPGVAFTLGATGASASSAAGTGTPAISAGVTGSSGASAAGTPGVSEAVAATGSAASGSAGTAGSTTAIGTTGASGGSAPGSATPASTAATTGAAATSSPGTLGASITIPITGNTATSAAGTMSASSPGTAAVSGSGGTSTAGALGPTLTLAATGASATTSAGSLSPGLSIGAAGTSISAAAGNQTPALTAGASGAAAAAGAGHPLAALALSVTSAGSTSTAGTVTPSAGTSAVLTGASATTQAGTTAVTMTSTVGLTGALVTVTAGSLSSGTPPAPRSRVGAGPTRAINRSGGPTRSGRS